MASLRKRPDAQALRRQSFDSRKPSRCAIIAEEKTTSFPLDFIFKGAIDPWNRLAEAVSRGFPGKASSSEASIRRASGWGIGNHWRHSSATISREAFERESSLIRDRYDRLLERVALSLSL
ncbi:hypothetical protein KM043_005835 [Ampulex compressa]|nr:hypothetical protein KM043_005835 [Ampulex compressa]